MFLVRECSLIADSHPGATTFSEVLLARLLSLAEGQHLRLLELSERVFFAFRDRAHSALNRYERMLNLGEHCPPGMRRVLSSHPSVEHWLVAYYAQQLLEELGRGVLNPRKADKDRVIEICRSLELVYPVHVNAFAKELFAQSLKYKRAEITAALRIILQSPGIGAGRLLRGHVCYLAGRLPLNQRPREFIQDLRAVIVNAQRELNENEALREASRLARGRDAKILMTHLDTAAASMFGMCGSLDLEEHLRRVRRELLLLQRSAYISLAYLGDSEAAHDYIHGLLTDADKDDMNRGFHLEYYGDIEYQPGNPLLSTDEDLHACPHVTNALVACLSNESSTKPLAAIQAVTLASLARHRHAEGLLDRVARLWIQKCFSAVLNRLSDLRDVCAFLQAASAELGQMFVVERYVDGLYELKYQRRAGWADIQPPESVAAHSYLVELLAKLFVPKTLAYRPRVLNLVALHDLGEAVTGDIPHPERTEDAKQRETRVVRRIAHFGALLGSPELMSLTEDYNVFEGRNDSDATAAAQDLDRLDLLIQLMRYKRENPSMPRFAEFHKYVEPEAFQSETIRKWATKFLKYFDAQIAGGVDQFASTQPVWPEKLNWARIGVKI
jgi:5'-deoxynucleotidase YfbR-like HD superfamily hydrolase